MFNSKNAFAVAIVKFFDSMEVICKYSHLVVMTEKAFSTSKIAMSLCIIMQLISEVKFKYTRVHM